MITEIAQIDIKPGMEAEFEAGVKKAVPIFKRAKGYKSVALQRSHEMPQRYRLFVGWETLEIDGHDHAALAAALDKGGRNGRPRVVIAHTVKGKGVSFMENQLAWHYKSPDAAQYEAARAELEGHPA